MSAGVLITVIVLFFGFTAAIMALICAIIAVFQDIRIKKLYINHDPNCNAHGAEAAG
jgi:uncharacterized membrane protein